MLARGRGKYRCGKCNTASNALEALFDDWPEAGSAPPAAGLSGEPPEAPRPPSRAGRWLLRAAWLVGGMAIGAVVIIKGSEFAGQPLVAPGEIDAALQEIGLVEAPPHTVFRDLGMIHLVSRQLVSDPERPGLLQLEATIVNRASRSQPYPDLEVVLFDAEGARLADYAFAPADYLAANVPPGADMAPQAYLPISLALDDPGVQAVGFELNFH